MTAATAIPYASLDAPRAELARRCREICLASQLSESGPATSLERDLSQALAGVRGMFGSESVHEEDLLELFRTEQARVADASILAELLAPRLAAWFENHHASAVPAASAQPRQEKSTDVSPPERRPLSASSTLPAPAGPPGIADLLDGMLEQDRQAERTGRTGSRR